MNRFALKWAWTLDSFSGCSEERNSAAENARNDDVEDEVPYGESVNGISIDPMLST